MASVDGLVSGLDTTTIISQLMQLERQPQSRLKTKQATVESAIGAAPSRAATASTICSGVA